MSREKEITKIKKQLIEGYNPEKIILFGSYGSGNSSRGSDIDIAVIKQTKQRFTVRLKEIARIVKSWRAFDILVYTPQEWQKGLRDGNYFLKEIAQTGKVIYEK